MIAAEANVMRLYLCRRLGGRNPETRYTCGREVLWRFSLLDDCRHLEKSAQDPKGVYRPIEAQVLFLYCVIYFDRWRYRESKKKIQEKEKLFM